MYVTTGAGTTYSATGSGLPVFRNSWRSLQKTGAVTNLGGLEEALRSRKHYTVSAAASWWTGAVHKISKVLVLYRHCCTWKDCWCRCHSGHWSLSILHNGSGLYLNYVLHDLQTVERRWTSPQPAPVEPARPAQQGHRPPCGCTATVETGLQHGQDHGHLSLHKRRHVNNLDQYLQLWNLPRGSAAQSGPWKPASAQRQGCQ